MIHRLLFPVALAAATCAAGQEKSTDAHPSSEARIQTLAAEIDSIISAKLTDLDQKPRPGIDDHAFARRAHLDLAGRIPTLPELTTFIADPSPEKRSILISDLLASKGYNSHFYNYWADLLRLKTIGDQLHHGGNFSQAIKSAVRENKPYDDMARELVGAKGRLYEKGNGFAGFKAREVMHLDRLANTTKTFLGLGIDCAQCHDHPFDDWTQKEFYQLAAFTSQVNLRVDPPAAVEKAQFAKIRKALKQEDFDTWIVYRESIRMKFANIEGTGTGYQRLPHDYQYNDGEAHEVLSAKVLFGDTPKLPYKITRKAVQMVTNHRFTGPNINSQARFAEWLASPDNAMFNKTTVNRLWHWVMGSELVGALGGLEISSEGKHPELTAKMISILKTLDYDVRAFFEVLLNTRAYQSRALSVGPEAPEYVLDGPLERRMTAQITWDSMLSLLVADPDKYVPTQFFYDGFTHFNEKTRDWSARDFETFSRKANLTRAGLYQRAHKEAKARNPHPGQPFERRASESEFVAHGSNPFYLEISKLFGASTRELLDGANTDPSIPQVLYLMNGKPETGLIGGDSALNRRMKNAAPSKTLDVLWLSIFNRPITPAERALAKKSGQTPNGIQDLTWALLNANEFRFVR